MANTIYPFANLTGGTDDSYLDYFDGNDLVDGDFAFGIDADGIHRTYKLDATSGATEDSPYVIAPDTNPGTKRWILMAPGGAMSHVNASCETAFSTSFGVAADVIYEVEHEDLLGEYNTTTGEFTATYDGLYQVVATVLTESTTWPSSGSLRLQVLVNSVIEVKGPIMPYGGVTLSGSTITFASLRLTAGDVVKIQVAQYSGGTLNVGGTAEYNILNIDRLV